MSNSSARRRTDAGILSGVSADTSAASASATDCTLDGASISQPRRPLGSGSGELLAHHFHACVLQYAAHALGKLVEELAHVLTLHEAVLELGFGKVLFPLVGLCE